MDICNLISTYQEKLVVRWLFEGCYFTHFPYVDLCEWTCRFLERSDVTFKEVLYYCQEHFANEHGSVHPAFVPFVFLSFSCVVDEEILLQRSTIWHQKGKPYMFRVFHDDMEYRIYQRPDSRLFSVYCVARGVYTTEDSVREAFRSNTLSSCVEWIKEEKHPQLRLMFHADWVHKTLEGFIANASALNNRLIQFTQHRLTLLPSWQLREEANAIYDSVQQSYREASAMKNVMMNFMGVCE
jgi:hypothetical protein